MSEFSISDSFTKPPCLHEDDMTSTLYYMPNHTFARNCKLCGEKFEVKPMFVGGGGGASVGRYTITGGNGQSANPALDENHCKD